MSHEDVTYARIREYYSSPLRNISQVWFSDIFTLKNLTHVQAVARKNTLYSTVWHDRPIPAQQDYITALCVLHDVSLEETSLTI